MFTSRKKKDINTMAKIQLINILFNGIDKKLQKKHFRFRETFRQSTTFFLWQQNLYRESTEPDQNG